MAVIFLRMDGELENKSMEHVYKEVKLQGRVSMSL